MEFTKTKTVYNSRLENYLREKRDELIYALSSQDYTEAQIGRIFKLDRARIHTILKKKPVGYKPKWVKRQDIA